jgi:hypothetical protein
VVLLRNEDTYLGALGSHLVEHFFGLVRHFCAGHDSADYFARAVRKATLRKIIAVQLGLKSPAKGENSDSGAAVSAADPIVRPRPFGHFMHFALQLFQRIVGARGFTSRGQRWERATREWSALSVFDFLEGILARDAQRDDRDLSLAKLAVGGGGRNFAQFKALAGHGELRGASADQ